MGEVLTNPSLGGSSQARLLVIVEGDSGIRGADLLGGGEGLRELEDVGLWWNGLHVGDGASLGVGHALDDDGDAPGGGVVWRRP